MNQDPVKTDQINWPRVLPWLHLFSSARFSFRLRVFAPAFLLFGICWGGMTLICTQFGTSEKGPLTPSEIDILQSFPWQDRSDNSSRLRRLTADRIPADYSAIVPAPVAGAVLAAISLLTDRNSSTRDIFLVIWTTVAMCLFVTAIGRAASSEFCKQTRVGVLAGLRFSVQHLRHTLLSSGIAALLIAFPFCLVVVMCWVLKFDLPEFIVMVTWPVAGLASMVLLVTVLIVGCGWLLSLSAVATDQCSGADALSRGINYVMSHKTRTTIYLTFALCVAGVTKQVAGFILNGAETILTQRLAPPTDADAAVRSTAFVASSVQAWWQPVLQSIPAAVQCGVFFAGTTIIYVLLRKQEDGIRLRDMDSER